MVVLTWNYHDVDVPAPDAPVQLRVAGLPKGLSGVQVQHYRIDGTHSNAYTAWKEIGSPQQPTAAQYARLEAAGQPRRIPPCPRHCPATEPRRRHRAFPRMDERLVVATVARSLPI